MRDRERRRVRTRQPLEAVAPYFLVIPLRTPGETAGVALLECGGARCVIPTEADRHHADPLGIDLRPRRKVIENWRRVVLGVGPQIKIAETDAFTVAGAVHDETGNATCDQVGHTFE